MNPTILIIIVLSVLILFAAFFMVKQQTAAIIERFGKFHSIRQSGLHLKIPLIDKVAGRLSLKILQLDVIVETKTLDDVFVKLKVSVQYKVINNKVYDAFYKLDYPADQITSYVFDVVRAEVPKMKLDDVFADQRREIARGLEESVEVLNKVGINSQEASALIVVTQHYDTLQSIGQETNSNLILLPNSPQAGSQMLNDMVASFTASNQIGEAMKNQKPKKKND